MSSKRSRHCSERYLLIQVVESSKKIFLDKLKDELEMDDFELDLHIDKTNPLVLV